MQRSNTLRIEIYKERKKERKKEKNKIDRR